MPRRGASGSSFGRPIARSYQPIGALRRSSVRAPTRSSASVPSLGDRSRRPDHSWPRRKATRRPTSSPRPPTLAALRTLLLRADSEVRFARGIYLGHAHACRPWPCLYRRRREGPRRRPTAPCFIRQPPIGWHLPGGSSADVERRFEFFPPGSFPPPGPFLAAT